MTLRIGGDKFPNHWGSIQILVVDAHHRARLECSLPVNCGSVYELRPNVQVMVLDPGETGSRLIQEANRFSYCDFVMFVHHSPGDSFHTNLCIDRIHFKTSASDCTHC